MYLTEAQARSNLEFQVGFIAAVSVMPEASSLQLMINDVVVGETFVRATSAVKTVRFKVPPGLIRVGLNFDALDDGASAPSRLLDSGDVRALGPDRSNANRPHSAART